MRHQWEPNLKGGSVLTFDDYGISYIKNGVLDDSGGTGETALIHHYREPRYLILNGDWRQDYDKIASQGYNACKAFYDSKKAEHRSRWSEDDHAMVTFEERDIILAAALDDLKNDLG